MMRKKTVGVIVLVLAVVSLAVAGALLLNNSGNSQNTAPSSDSSDNGLLGGVGGNGGDGGVLGGAAAMVELAAVETVGMVETAVPKSISILYRQNYRIAL